MKKVPYFRGQISCRLSLSSVFFFKHAYNKHVTIFLTQQHFVFSEKRAGPYLGFFVCGGKLGFREISDQYSYKKQPSKIRHYVRKKTFSFPGGGNCPLRPPAMYGPDVSFVFLRNHWILSTVVMLLPSLDMP